MTKEELLNNLTADQKAKLTVGKDFWHTADVAEKIGLLLTDGPNGLRKQVGKADNLGLNESVKSPCFPTASCLACSFDRDLIFEVGKGIAVEAAQNDVALLLGPAINLKRSPLGGRNFEYYSEDPYLSGILGAAFIRGVQSLGVGACIKHFACNNQEYARMVNDSIVDERALFELYLKPFELAIKHGKPKAVMASYNKVNGRYVCENSFLLKTVLREKWGFSGLVLSDWGAVSNKVESVKAGLNLEMPCSLSYIDILAALQDKQLTMAELDEAITPLLDFSLNYTKSTSIPSIDSHELAYRAACESIVLLKNEDEVLPLAKGEKVVIMGDLNFPFQGCGSSRINPLKTSDLATELAKAKADFEILDKIDELKIKQAEKIVYILTLPKSKTTEGKDRSDLKLADADLNDLDKIISLNSNVIVVLAVGSVVEMPFLAKIKGLVLPYLAGEAAYEALVSILYGEVNPSGKLAETWPFKLEDSPVLDFAGDIYQTYYKESLFIGYRYYEKTQIKPAFSFGYGLSYTKFAIVEARIIDKQLEVWVKNIGKYPGQEVIQIYVSDQNKDLIRPFKELKDFRKIFLKPQEQQKIVFDITEYFFEIYNEGFTLSGGNYTIFVGNSADNCSLALPYYVDAEVLTSPLGKYHNFKNISEITLGDFKKLYAKPFPISEPIRPFTLNSAMIEIKQTLFGKIFCHFVIKKFKKEFSSPEELEMNLATFMTAPIRFIGMRIKKTNRQLQGLVDMANGQIVRGFLKFYRKDKSL